LPLAFGYDLFPSFVLFPSSRQSTSSLPFFQQVRLSRNEAAESPVGELTMISLRFAAHIPRCFGIFILPLLVFYRPFQPSCSPFSLTRYHPEKVLMLGIAVGAPLVFFSSTLLFFSRCAPRLRPTFQERSHPIPFDPRISLTFSSFFFFHSFCFTIRARPDGPRCRAAFELYSLVFPLRASSSRVITLSDDTSFFFLSAAIFSPLESSLGMAFAAASEPHCNLILHCFQIPIVTWT